MSYDLVVIGGGPTGLMAAKTAAHKGLRVAVIERKADVALIRRACCSHLVMEEGYGHETIRVSDDRIIFTQNGFEVTYCGTMIPIQDKTFSSPGEHKVRFSQQDGTPIGIKIQKGLLLQGLQQECTKLGVTFLLGTRARHIEDSQAGVEVFTVRKGKSLIIKAARAIVAEGVNARLTGLRGMNAARKHHLTAHVVKYILSDFKGYRPGTWNFYFGQAFHSHAPVLIGPSFYGDSSVEVTIMGSQALRPDRVFKRVAEDSPLADMFHGTRVIDKHACSLKVRDPLKLPYNGHVLVAGDACAYIEVEIQGGLMCGYQSGLAVYRELNAEKGFEQYAGWWQQAFEFNGADWLKVAQGYALVPAYTDDELDYLFSLIEDEVLPGTFSQYTTPKLLWAAILRHQSKIAVENPVVFDKINKIGTLSLAASFNQELASRDSLSR